MYLFSVDFSKNNLLTEQINLASFYNLPVLDKLLIEHQLINFADLPIEKAYLVDVENSVDFSLFDTAPIVGKNIYKELALAEKGEKFIAFRNDIYFEISSLRDIVGKCDELVYLKDKNGVVFCVIGNVEFLKRLYNKNLLLSDVFKQREKYASPCIELYDGYIKALDNIKCYQSLLFDILNGKALYKPPFVAEGVFTTGVVPKGDFSIVPPVFLGETVQIESGSVIGPNTVIYDNTLISENTSVKNSVLFENVFVSSNCFVDGSVCCDNASIKRNSAVFSGSVIGADALIGEDTTLDNGSFINKNVKYDNLNLLAYKNKNHFSFKNLFQGLTPDKASLLGSAVSVVFKRPKIIVGCDGSTNALSLKLAFLSGLIASGNECLDVGVTFKAQMFFSSLFCGCNYSVFFSGKGGGTNIEIFNSENVHISKTDCCNLFDFCNKGDFVFRYFDECQNIRQIRGLRRMYIREITAFSDTDLPFVSKVICENKALLKTLEELFKMCLKNNENGNGFTVYMNESGTNVNIEFKEKFYTQKTLKKLVFYFWKNNGNSGIFESELYKELWRYDSVFLVITVLNIIKAAGEELDTLISKLPEFYIKSKNLNLKKANSEIAGKISSKFNFKHQKGVFDVKYNDGFVRIKNNNQGENIKIICASNNMATSEEICNFFYGILE